MLTRSEEAQTRDMDWSECPAVDRHPEKMGGVKVLFDADTADFMQRGQVVRFDLEG